MNNAARCKEYFPALCRFMGHKDGTTYRPATAEFSEEALLAILPTHLVSFFNKLAFGVEDPAAGALPTECRSSTLYNYKKKISWFHPLRDHQWDSIGGRGNPTRSQAVNQMIQLVKVHEVRQTGRDSKARWPLDIDEFVKLVNLADAIVANDVRAARFRCLITLQWQLIGRVDDMQKVKVSCCCLLCFASSLLSPFCCRIRTFR